MKEIKSKKSNDEQKKVKRKKRLRILQFIKRKIDNVKLEKKPHSSTKDEVYTEYRKYLISRKDGKIHWETWNGYKIHRVPFLFVFGLTI